MFKKETKPMTEEECMRMREKIEERKLRNSKIRKEACKFVYDVAKVIVAVAIYDAVMDVIDKQ